MSVVCFCSPKGGVGKTSLSINVAGVLARSGLRVLVVDLDVQNSMRLHAGIQLADDRGWAHCLVYGRSIREGVLPGGANLLVLPFGQVTGAQLHAVSDHLARNENWLANTLAPFIERGFVVVVDTPPGPSVFLDQTRPISTLDIVVLQADATSVSLLSTVESQNFLGRAPEGVRREVRYVFNLVDMRRKLTRDVIALLRRRLGQAMLGIVNYDDSFGEAVAHQQLVIDRAPTSKAAADVRGLAASVQGLLLDGTEPGRP
ncbi:cellulose synthase operon protein YhjQ/BcsQ [uncultured Reyranella sp.]|uniref:cellulose synthase operon protein YhjQ/BcsQ n=1 Tax=uncultured Reyranella sp. TaxID=735512 RepID=UPI0025F35488|nr:cellulose synthase operon protein YhjQ/BcsQ [uncultured Reyranella sp.]